MLTVGVEILGIEQTLGDELGDVHHDRRVGPDRVDGDDIDVCEQRRVRSDNPPGRSALCNHQAGDHVRGFRPTQRTSDLVAQPHGKRLQSVSLLSGGEKALTGLALLFAIFYYRPSPFCVLDEVDAPLDDANIHRFLRVLKELAQDTQFLVITHNRRTMEAADVLYGVTMEEPGLSRLVSVKLA